MKQQATFQRRPEILITIAMLWWAKSHLRFCLTKESDTEKPWARSNYWANMAANWFARRDYYLWRPSTILSSPTRCRKKRIIELEGTWDVISSNTLLNAGSTIQDATPESLTDGYLASAQKLSVKESPSPTKTVSSFVEQLYTLESFFQCLDQICCTTIFTHWF